MVAGYAQLGVMQDKELAKGSRLCNCNQRQLQGNWRKKFKWLPKYSGPLWIDLIV